MALVPTYSIIQATLEPYDDFEQHEAYIYDLLWALLYDRENPSAALFEDLMVSLLAAHRPVAAAYIEALKDRFNEAGYVSHWKDWIEEVLVVGEMRHDVFVTREIERPVRESGNVYPIEFYFAHPKGRLPDRSLLRGDLVPAKRFEPIEFPGDNQEPPPYSFHPTAEHSDFRGPASPVSMIVDQMSSYDASFSCSIPEETFYDWMSGEPIEHIYRELYYEYDVLEALSNIVIVGRKWHGDRTDSLYLFDTWTHAEKLWATFLTSFSPRFTKRRKALESIAQVFNSENPYGPNTWMEE